MVQTMKEYQKEYFEKEGYTIIDNMENAISAFCERYPQHANVAEESILNDTNCDWVVLNDGSVAVLPGILDKPVCEVSEYYGDNVFMLVSRVNKALQRAGQTEKAEALSFPQIHQSFQLSSFLLPSFIPPFFPAGCYAIATSLSAPIFLSRTTPS